MDLCEFLIKTHSNEGNLLLDHCSGSGVIAEACLNTKRDFICMELCVEFVEKSQERITKWKPPVIQPELFQEMI